MDFFLREWNKTIIKRIGYRTYSKETREIMMFTFISTFANTAILFLLAKVDNQYFPGLPNVDPNDIKTSSHSADMDKNWYGTNSSVLVMSMIVSIFTPQIDFMI